MSSLTSGVLVSLIADMKEKEMSWDDRKPALLQIRSIVPVLSEGDLWPNRGFYLEVTDASHAMYVSLPQEQDDLILCNKLQIGQYIYADKMEASYPVPVLIGVRPIPGRNSGNGAPKDLVSIDNLVEIHGASNTVSMREMSDPTEEKPKPNVRSSSASRGNMSRKIGGRTVKNVARKCCVDRTLSEPDDWFGPDKSSDSESTLSACSETRITKRKSWNGKDSMKMDETSEPQFQKHKLRPISISHYRRRSTISPVQSLHGNSSDRPSSKNTHEEIIQCMEPRTMKSRSAGTPKKSEVPLEPAAMFSMLLNRTRTEDRIQWSSLPPNLMKLGKEVLKQRDVALLASVEALQDASAAERFLKCLRTYSELQSSDSEDEQPPVEKFFELQDDLAHSQLVLKSMTNVRPLTSEIDPISPNSAREAGKLALDRRRNASVWIKAALASDLIPLSTATKPCPSLEAPKAPKKCSGGAANGGLVRKQKKSSESTIKEHKLEWSKGSPLSATADLASSLQNEFRTLFLAHVERYLDGLKSQFLMESISNSQTVSLMLQIKRVSDWLDLMVKKETSCAKVGSKEGSDSDYPEFDVYGRVRNKIYRILLMHIEKTAQRPTCATQIDQSRSGEEGEKPEWRVNVPNPCLCAFTDAILACPGFRSAKKMDPCVLNQTGVSCLLDGSKAVGPDESFSFTYTWDVLYAFKVAGGHWTGYVCLKP